jgi:ribosome assembly protein YihI (activator of Der GTPase)
LSRESQKCTTIEPLFRAFQEKVEDEITAIEKTNENASLAHLLQTLYKCQQISIKDKFFYDALFENIEKKMHKIVDAKEMVLLGVSLASNKDF